MFDTLNKRIRDILKLSAKEIEDAPQHFGYRADDVTRYEHEVSAFDDPRRDERKAWAREDLKGWIEIDH